MLRLLLVAVLVGVWAQQVDRGPAPSESPVRGLYNWIHSTGNAEQSFSFYREVLGLELARPTTSNPAAMPFEWRVQDVGAPQFQLEVAGLDALLERTVRAGYQVLSVGAKPIQRPFGRFVFVIDPDGILVEFVERSTSAR